MQRRDRLRTSHQVGEPVDVRTAELRLEQVTLASVVPLRAQQDAAGEQQGRRIGGRRREIPSDLRAQHCGELGTQLVQVELAMGAAAGRAA